MYALVSTSACIVTAAWPPAQILCAPLYTFTEWYDACIRPKAPELPAPITVEGGQLSVLQGLRTRDHNTLAEQLATFAQGLCGPHLEQYALMAVHR